jgi:RNA polymerase sigma factor (sigma-70 family)
MKSLKPNLDWAIQAKGQRSARLALPNEAELALLGKYTPLVRRAAYALQNMRPMLLDQEDVIQDGMIGLLRAIRSSRGQPSDAQFAAFAGLNIRGAIIDGYRAIGEISRYDYSEAKKTRQDVSAGKEVSADDRAKADQLFALAWTPPVPIGGSSDDNFQVSDPDPGPEQRAISNQLLRRAIDQLQKTPVRDRSIFIACELQGDKHAQVAKRFKLSSGRISQILKQVRQDVMLAIA